MKARHGVGGLNKCNILSTFPKIPVCDGFFFFFVFALKQIMQRQTMIDIHTYVHAKRRRRIISAFVSKRAARLESYLLLCTSTIHRYVFCELEGDVSTLPPLAITHILI